jgi:hypothetical protein
MRYSVEKRAQRQRSPLALQTALVKLPNRHDGRCRHRARRVSRVRRGKS